MKIFFFFLLYLPNCILPKIYIYIYIYIREQTKQQNIDEYLEHPWTIVISETITRFKSHNNFYCGHKPRKKDIEFKKTWKLIMARTEMK